MMQSQDVVFSMDLSSVKKLDETGNVIIHSPPTQEEFFTMEIIKEMDSFKDI